MSGTAATSSPLRRLAAHATEPIDPASIAMFRIMFGLVLCYEAITYIRNGWVLHYYVNTEMQFNYYGFSWVRVLDAEWMLGLFLVAGLTAFMMAAGFLYRIAAPIFFLTVTYWFLLDQTRYLNHMYLVSLYAFLLCLVPAHRAWSLDSLVFRSPHNGFAPRWSLWILQFQMGCVYFFGAIAKINRDWLYDGEPLNMWLYNRTDKALLVPFTQWEHFGLFMSWSGFLIDLLAVPFLLWKRTRVAMFLILLTFHLSNKYMFHIGIFPWMSIAATTLFLSASWPRVVLRLPPFRLPPWPLPKPSLVIPIVLIPFVLLQLFLPVRHHLYPSDVAWSEEGHRFAWRMKLRSKVAEGYFMVQTEDLSHIEIIRPDTVLPRHQLRQVLTRPDMVLQFAHRLAREESERLGEPVQVFANITCQLNHHEPQRLIDPSVDLAQVQRSLAPSDWIMPFRYSPIRGWTRRGGGEEEVD